MGYVYVALTVLLTVYGQLVIKWQLAGKVLPEPLISKVLFLLAQLLNPWVFSGLFAAFVAALCWMAAMTKLPLSQAYPFTSLAIVLVFVASSVLFGESITSAKVLGTLLIVAGLFVISR